MLTIIVPETELFDSSRNEFIYIKEQTLSLEHSLVSVKKWESKWKKPFLNDSNRTVDEMIDYIRCMTITKNVNPLIYENLPAETFRQINDYIEDSMTATTFVDEKHMPGSREQITAELIYFWMVNFGIPFECQKWHLNQLLTLIKICSIKASSSSGKKMKPGEILKQNHDLNKIRRARLKSKG